MAKKTVIVYTFDGAIVTKKYDTISNAVSMLTVINKNADMNLVSVAFSDWYKLPAHNAHLIQMGA